MHEVIVFAEGPTEERFIKQVVAPALHGLQIYLKPQLLKTSQSGRGGALSIDRFLLNARNTLRQKPDAVLSSFIDLYGLDTDFPAFEESQSICHRRTAAGRRGVRSPLMGASSWRR